jgi:opacity protein-like surface antigen
MKRLGRWVAGIGAVAACVTGTASAQSATPDSGKFSAAFTVGATLGHKSSSSFGGEVDYKLGTEWEAFVEFGRMRNVASSDTDDRALVVANSIGASVSSVAAKATYFDAGVKYLFLPFKGGYQPYANLGFGAARVSQSVVFGANGAELSESQLLDQYGVQLGSDLAGSTTKPLFLLGAGVSRNFLGRYYFDVSYRYGRIFAKTGTIEDDKGINSQRFQVGVGIHF